MLGKLLKYDFKMFFQLCLPIYGVGLVLAIVNGVMIGVNGEHFYQPDSLMNYLMIAFQALSIFAIMCVAPIASLLVASRIYKGVFGKEGFLTNTLPVSHHMIIVEKTLFGCLATIITVVALGIMITVFAVLIEGMDVFTIFKASMDALGFTSLELGSKIQIIVLAVVGMVVGNLYGWLLVYLSIAIGHLSKNRLIASIGVYLGITYFVIQPISTVLSLGLINRITNVPVEIGEGFADMMVSLFSMSARTTIIQSIVFGAICYALSAMIMKKKLNLVG